MVSPIENAIETMEDKNKRLMTDIEEHRHSTLRIDPLSMLLNGIVDPAVQGGIAMYKVSKGSSVKPATRGHLGDLAKLSSADRCPLYRGIG
jgi:hypothetical protein